jgi:hypothetical protein
MGSGVVLQPPLRKGGIQVIEDVGLAADRPMLRPDCRRSSDFLEVTPRPGVYLKKI